MYVEPLRVVLQKEDFRALQLGEILQLKTSDGKTIELTAERKKKYAVNVEVSDMATIKRQRGELDKQIIDVLVKNGKPMLASEIKKLIPGVGSSFFGKLSDMKLKHTLLAKKSGIIGMGGRNLLSYYIKGNGK